MRHKMKKEIETIPLNWTSLRHENCDGPGFHDPRTSAEVLLVAVEPVAPNALAAWRGIVTILAIFLLPIALSTVRGVHVCHRTWQWV